VAEGPFETLIRVQDLDTELARLEHRRAALPERQALAALEGRLAQLAARTAEARRVRDALGARQDDLEAQIGALNQRRQGLEDRLYAARGTAARDLAAIDEEVRHLTGRRAELEDAELAVMEEQEPVDAELDRLAEERAPVEVEAEDARRALAEADAEVAAELERVAAERGRMAADLPTDLADRYETLRARLKGTGAARLVGNRCEGCHLELPSMEVDRIRRLPPDTVVTCDQCGRILVR
jgi:predicted  nucleic acid-binding Zn-ribbon protein